MAASPELVGRVLDRVNAALAARRNPSRTDLMTMARLLGEYREALYREAERQTAENRP